MNLSAVMVEGLQSVLPVLICNSKTLKNVRRSLVYFSIVSRYCILCLNVVAILFLPQMDVMYFDMIEFEHSGRVEQWGSPDRSADVALFLHLALLSS